MARSYSGIRPGLDASRLLDQFYACLVTMRARQFRVTSNQRGIQNFGKHDVRRIVRGHGVAQCLNPFQQVLVLGAFDVNCNVIVEGLLDPGRGDFFEAHEAAKRLCDLDVDQVRSMETFFGVQHPRLHLDAFVSTQQKLEYG